MLKNVSAVIRLVSGSQKKKNRGQSVKDINSKQPAVTMVSGSYRRGADEYIGGQLLGWKNRGGKRGGDQSHVSWDQSEWNEIETFL